MKVDADKFEHYHCYGKISVGINMMNMFKLIKAMSNNDILTIFIEKDRPNKMGLKINNVDKNIFHFNPYKGLYLPLFNIGHEIHLLFDDNILLL